MIFKVVLLVVAVAPASTLRPTHSSLLATLEALETDLASLTALSAERSTRRDSTGVAPGEFWNWTGVA